MKDGAHAAKPDANAGPTPFANLPAKRFKKRLDVSPRDVGPDGIGEDSAQS
jgi:hypothetical protein